MNRDPQLAPSFRRKPESSGFKENAFLSGWIPACAGMTASLSNGFFGINSLFRIVLLSAALTGGIAAAVEFKQVQANESSVTFGYKQMGVAMEGKFAKFTAQTTFDPAKLAKSQARIEINLASIDTGVEEANDEVKGKLWFNTQAFPSASFVSTGVKALGGNRYEATGKLTIKGKTLDVVAPFSFETNGARGIFDGLFTIGRLDYNIGEGIWADVSAVANEVRIKFHLVVTAAPGNQ